MRALPHLLAWYAGLARPETQTTSAEREAIVRHARGCRRVVEVGVWHGVTTALLRDAMDPRGVLWAVDPFPPGRLGFNPQRPIASGHVGRVRNGTVRWVRTTGTIAADLYRDSGEDAPDLVFIDGDHSYEAAAGDWRAWSRLVRAGGVIGLHDSRATPGRDISSAGSARVTRDLVLTERRFETLEIVDSLTIVRCLAAAGSLSGPASTRVM